MGMKADSNDDMMIDEKECGNLEDDMESMVCNAIVDHCDLNGDGSVCGCEFLACVYMHGKETGCVSECPCSPEDDSMYCQGLEYCVE
jgi:hypothetical protein